MHADGDRRKNLRYVPNGVGESDPVRPVAIVRAASKKRG
jgi:hypothetical protein